MFLPPGGKRSQPRSLPDCSTPHPSATEGGVLNGPIDTEGDQAVRADIRARVAGLDDAPAEVRAILSAAVDSVGSTATARAMPPRAYLSDAFHAFEREAVFGREWLMLCHDSEVAEPGSRLAVTVLDEPLLVTRDDAGQIHVLSAVCQHRSYVMSDDTGSSAKVLRCPYHAWTYGLDGCLVGAPLMSRDRDLDELRARIRLPSLRVEVWQGLVFANFDPDAEPLAPRLAALESAMAPYQPLDLVVARSVEYPDLPYNWKVLRRTPWRSTTPATSTRAFTSRCRPISSSASRSSRMGPRCGDGRASSTTDGPAPGRRGRCPTACRPRRPTTSSSSRCRR